ncbi:MAG: prolipoprotein diacylglyceryl transferase [Candidatus Aceula meridiana]|nr:prolipoprotein diacylglyceryl transferase [Candidatus Aceula meridiana]
MHPILFQIGPVTIYSYGAMLAVALIVCSLLLGQEAKRKGIDPDIIVDLIFWLAAWGIVGSRIFFVILNFSFFKKNLFEILMVHHGGLAWQGGLIFASLAGIIFIKRKKLLFWETLDLVAPYVALGQAIGRIGCFLNGCCYGQPSTCGIYFPVHQDILYPTQLYSSFALILIFVVLKFCQKFNPPHGQIFFWYFILASVQRFFIQFLRADYDPIFLGLGIFQIVNLIILTLAFYGNIYFNRRR